ncbi:hypothetical protein BaRGS_00027859, partial [Batillaria attramentaria]
MHGDDRLFPQGRYCCAKHCGIPLSPAGLLNTSRQAAKIPGNREHLKQACPWCDVTYPQPLMTSLEQTCNDITFRAATFVQSHQSPARGAGGQTLGGRRVGAARGREGAR